MASSPVRKVACPRRGSRFPAEIGRRYAGHLSAHPLRRQIIITGLVNDMVNHGGITFAFRCQEETSASAEQVARAYIVCREIFDFDGYSQAIEALDGVVTTHQQSALHLAFRRLLDRAVRWFLQARPGMIDIAAEIARFGPVVAELAPQLERAMTQVGKHPSVVEVRTGIGLLAGVQLVDAVSADAITRVCVESGILLRALPSNTIQISPPFIVEESDLWRIAGAVAAALDHPDL